MNIIIPIGGIGQRFRTDGYLSPKPLIRFLGQPMLFWIIENLSLNEDDVLYIVYHKDLRDYHFKDQLRNRFPNLTFKFVELYYQTEGAVETLLLALKTIEDLSRKVVSLDCDTFYKYDVLSTYRQIEQNCVFYFEDTQDKPIYSYLELDENNKILSIKEKVKISSHANTGCYCFYNGEVLMQYCKALLKLGTESLDTTEYYISSVIKMMLKEGENFVGHQINQSDFVCLGTPHLLKINSQQQKLITPKRFCFDLDHTLVSTIVPGDYANVRPIWRNINLSKYLKSLGHTIIIYTARRMKTHDGNLGKVTADIAKLTFETLDKYGVEYDEIYFGKPYADYYLDDLAINSYLDLEKELGYYQLLIPERDHHDLKIDCETVHKEGSVEGEIFWYQHIPNNLVDLFPKLLKVADDNKKWYEIERIEGVTLSHYYLNGNLTPKLLTDFLFQLNRIHESESPEVRHLGTINKYANYVEKLDQRYQEYDYSRFTNADQTYQTIRKLLLEYQNKDSGRLWPIHGDPVFTNVILTKFMDIKLIDMRGKQGDILTIYGDKLYDYAKVYQSLIGYDEILLNKRINLDYREELINTFHEYLKEKFDWNVLEIIQAITASLLFTLIPLHDNEKCLRYYNLIFTILRK